MRFLMSHLLTVRTPIGRKMATMIRSGGAPLLRVRRQELSEAGVDLTEARTTGVKDGRPILADGRVLDVANVLWCTGFGPEFDWIKVPILGDDGWPDQKRGVVRSAPGIYMLGVPFQYGFTSMLVLGAARDAGYVVEQIARSAVGRRLAGVARGGARLTRPISTSRSLRGKIYATLDCAYLSRSPGQPTESQGYVASVSHPGNGYHWVPNPITFRQCGQKKTNARPIPNDPRGLRA